MRILSWDVGIHHLSYCILDQDDETKVIKIKNWGIIDLVDDPSQKKNITLIFENIPKKFDEKPELLDGIDKVCIENQPTLRNPTMKTVQIIIYSYFLIRGKTDLKEHPIQQISFISATNKLKVYNGPAIDPDLYTKTGKLKNVPKTTLKLKKNQPLILDYIEKVEEEKKEEEEEVKAVIEEETPKKASAVCYGDKKKLSILYTREMIKKDQPDFLAYFESNQKKDDLADSFLQGYYVLTQKEIQQQQKIKKQEEKKNQPKKPRKSKKKNVIEQLNQEEVVEPTPTKAKRGGAKKKEESEPKKVTTRGRKKKVNTEEEVKKEDFHYLQDSSSDES